MAQKKTSPIALELERYEKKIRQFQDYLDRIDINEIDDDFVRHKEIGVQRDLMKDLGSMLGQLAILREQEEKIKETRGDVAVNRRMRE